MKKKYIRRKKGAKLCVMKMRASWQHTKKKKESYMELVIRAWKKLDTTSYTTRDSRDASPTRQSIYSPFFSYI